MNRRISISINPATAKFAMGRGHLRQMVSSGLEMQTHSTSGSGQQHQSFGLAEVARTEVLFTPVTAPLELSRDVSLKTAQGADTVIAESVTDAKTQGRVEVSPVTPESNIKKTSL